MNNHVHRALETREIVKEYVHALVSPLKFMVHYNNIVYTQIIRFNLELSLSFMHESYTLLLNITIVMIIICICLHIIMVNTFVCMQYTLCKLVHIYNYS